MRGLILKPLAILAATIILSMMYASLSVYIIEGKVTEAIDRITTDEDRVLRVATHDLRHRVQESDIIIRMVADAKNYEEAIFLIDKTFELLNNEAVAIVDLNGDVIRSWGIKGKIPNLAYRHYFRDALKKGRGASFITGNVTGKDGLVIAERIAFGNDEYVVLTKTSKSIFQNGLIQFSSTGRKLYAIDDLGIAYMNTIEPGLLFNTNTTSTVPGRIANIIHRYPGRSVKSLTVLYRDHQEIQIEQPFMDGKIISIIPIQSIEIKRIQNYMLVLIVYLFGLFLVIALIMTSVLHAKAHGDLL